MKAIMSKNLSPNAEGEDKKLTVIKIDEKLAERAFESQRVKTPAHYAPRSGRISIHTRDLIDQEDRERRDKALKIAAQRKANPKAKK